MLALHQRQDTCLTPHHAWSDALTKLEVCSNRVPERESEVRAASALMHGHDPSLLLGYVINLRAKVAVRRAICALEETLSLHFRLEG